MSPSSSYHLLSTCQHHPCANWHNTTCLHLHHVICYRHVSTNHVLTDTMLHVFIFIIPSAIYMSTPTMCSLTQYYMSSSSSYHLLSTCQHQPCAHRHNTTCLHLHHIICYLHVYTNHVLTDAILHVFIFIIPSAIYMSTPTMCSLTQYYMLLLLLLSTPLHQRAASRVQHPNHVAANSLSPQVAMKGSTLSGFVQRSRLEREVGRDLHSNKWEEV